MDLSLRELTESVIGDDRPEQPFGTYVFSGTDPGAELGREIERQVFLEYFGNSPRAARRGVRTVRARQHVLLRHRPPADEPGRRDAHDRAVGRRAEDARRHRAGLGSHDRAAVRVGRRAAADPARIWDVSTLAVAADYRGRGSEGLISLALYQALFQAALPFAVDYFVTILDLVVLDLIQTRMGRPLSHFRGVEPKDYLDSPSSIPVYIDIPDYGVRLASHIRRSTRSCSKAPGSRKPFRRRLGRTRSRARARGPRRSTRSERLRQRDVDDFARHPLTQTAEECGHLVGRRRSRVDVALRHVDAQRLEPLALHRRLDAFGDGGLAERPRHGDDRGDERSSAELLDRARRRTTGRS